RSGCRAHGRILGDDLRALLPGRIREHDPGVDPDLDPVPRWMAVPGRLPAGWFPLAGAQDRVHPAAVPVGASHLPALPLRPHHAPGLEGVHSGDAGVGVRGCLVAYVAAVDLELRRPWVPRITS